MLAALWVVGICASALAQELDPPASGSSESVIIIDDGGTDAPVADAEIPFVDRTRLTLELSTRLNVDTQLDGADEDVLEWWNRARMTFSYETPKDLRVFADAWVRWGTVAERPRGGAFFVFNAEDAKWTRDVQLREAFVQWRRGGLTLLGGQKIYVWGKNEWLPAADVLNPRDVRFDLVGALRSGKDTKVPVISLEADYTHDRKGLQMVVLPFFHSNEFFLTGRDFSLAAPGSDLRRTLRGAVPVTPSAEDEFQRGLVGTRLPEESPKGASVALRGRLNGGGWDFAATAYYGWDRTPVLDLDPDLRTLFSRAGDIAADPQLLINDAELRDATLQLQQKAASGDRVLDVSYRRLSVFALEAEGVVGDFVLRADGGFSPKQTYYTADFESVRLATVQGVVGVEYAYGTTWFLSVSGYAQAALDAPQDVTLAVFERSDDDPANRRAAYLGGLAGTVRWFWEAQNLELSGTWIWNIKPGDYVVTLGMMYRDLEPHVIGVGGVILGGPRGTVGGLFERNDFVYVEYSIAW